MSQPNYPTCRRNIDWVVGWFPWMAMSLGGKREQACGHFYSLFLE